MSAETWAWSTKQPRKLGEWRYVQSIHKDGWYVDNRSEVGPVFIEATETSAAHLCEYLTEVVAKAAELDDARAALAEYRQLYEVVSKELTGTRAFLQNETLRLEQILLTMTAKRDVGREALETIRDWPYRPYADSELSVHDVHNMKVNAAAALAAIDAVGKEGEGDAAG